jgi:FixJ family two-component response regulator
MHEPTVFVVDDDQAVRESLQFLLESEDLKVESFE